MNIRYSPLNSSRVTRIAVVSRYAIEIDGEFYDFADDIAHGCVAWPQIAEATKAAIREAHVEDGELCLKIRRRFTGPRPQWDDGQYHEVAEGEAI